MSIQQWSEHIWLAQLSNEPSLSEDLLSLKERAEQAQPSPDIVLDLSGVTQLNSSNLSQLLRIRKLAVDRKVKLILASPSDAIWAVFLTTGLDQVFEFVGEVSTRLDEPTDEPESQPRLTLRAG